MADIPPRVFLSSVMNGYGEMRAAARRGIVRAGADPVMAEDFGSQPMSSRNACLDGVASCDGLVLVIGARGGFIAPSGKPVVHEEFEEAIRRKIPAWIFLEDVDRDEDARVLANRLSDYVNGRHRSTFATADELEQRVLASVQSFAKSSAMPNVENSRLQALVLGDFDRNDRHPTIRIGIAPDRVADFEEWVDDSKVKALHEIAHASDLFSFERRGSSRVTSNSVTVEQNSDGYDNALDRVTVDEQGVILVESRLTDRQRDRSALGAFSLMHMVIPAELIEDRVGAALSFAHLLYSNADAYLRHTRFHLAVAIAGYSSHVVERNPQPRSSMNIPQYRATDPVTIHNEPTMLSREDLAMPKSTIVAAVKRLLRRLNDLNMNPVR